MRCKKTIAKTQVQAQKKPLKARSLQSRRGGPSKRKEIMLKGKGRDTGIKKKANSCDMIRPASAGEEKRGVQRKRGKLGEKAPGPRGGKAGGTGRPPITREGPAKKT